MTVEERRRRGQPSLTNIVRIVSREWKLSVCLQLPIFVPIVEHKCSTQLKDCMKLENTEEGSLIAFRCSPKLRADVDQLADKQQRLRSLCCLSDVRA